MMTESVFCLVNALFCVTYWNIYLYCTNSKETHKSCVCFQHAILPTILPVLVFACWKQTKDLCVSLLFVQYRYIPILVCNTKQYIYRINFALLHHSRTYNNVYIGIKREKGRDLTQSCDKNPYTNRTIQKATWQHKTRPKTFITQLLRTDLGRSVGVTAVTQLVFERSTPPTHRKKAVQSIGHGTIEILFIIQTDFHKDGNMLIKNNMKLFYITLIRNILKI